MVYVKQKVNVNQNVYVNQNLLHQPQPTVPTAAVGRLRGRNKLTILGLFVWPHASVGLVCLN